MKRLSPVLFPLLAVMLAPAPFAQADSVRAVRNHGQDGDVTYYEVQCKDGSMGSIQVHLDPPKVCVTPPYKDGACRAHWELREAAQRACR